MPHIVIISSSIREKRKSHRVAMYLDSFMREHNLADVEILDLKEYNFPIFEDTLKNLENPYSQALEFAKKIKETDGIIIVTPEYNGSIPASLKNAIDLLYEEWRGKPISLCTVSSGKLGGSQALISLQFTLWKMGAWTVTSMFPISEVEKTFNSNGIPLEKADTDKLTHVYLAKLMESMEANELAPKE